MKTFVVLFAMLACGCLQQPEEMRTSEQYLHGSLVTAKTVKHEEWEYVVFYAQNGRMQVLLHPSSQADLADMIRERAAKASLAVECDACRAVIQQANN